MIYINFWGGEGFLSAAALLAMASTGMFEGATEPITYRCMDFAIGSYDDNRRIELQKAYNKYFPIVFGTEAVNPLTVQDIVLEGNIAHFSTPETLVGKFRLRETIAVGVSEADMKQNIRKGIYGKPWVGEAYHSNSNFSPLYQTASGDVVVINCGGYKGGGTAATFIPLENGYHVHQHHNNVNNPEIRFNVIAGPSTEFNHTVKIDHPEIYQGNVKGISSSGEADLFDIPKILERLDDMDSSFADVALDHHKDNKTKLHNIYYSNVKVESTNKDYSNLNPKEYMGKFVDRIRSDDSFDRVNATFINMKANLKQRSCQYDKTCDEFLPDNQKHKLHITNLLNAITIQELINNHANYNDNAIYTFCAVNNDKYTVKEIFLEEDVKRIYRFLAFSTILVKYVYSYFDDIDRLGAQDMLKKWVREKTEGKVFKKTIIPTDNNSDEGKINRAFAQKFNQTLTTFVVEFIRPVVKVFMEIQETSDDVELFAGNDKIQACLNDIDKLELTIEAIQNPEEIIETTNKALAAIIMGQGTFPANFDEALQNVKGNQGDQNDFLAIYQKEFPVFGNQGKKARIWDAEITPTSTAKAEEAAEAYCKEVIRYTYEKVKSDLL